MKKILIFFLTIILIGFSTAVITQVLTKPSITLDLNDTEIESLGRDLSISKTTCVYDERNICATYIIKDNREIIGEITQDAYYYDARTEKNVNYTSTQLKTNVESQTSTIVKEYVNTISKTTQSTTQLDKTDIIIKEETKGGFLFG